jgi:hypothetical protein
VIDLTRTVRRHGGPVFWRNPLHALDDHIPNPRPRRDEGFLKIMLQHLTRVLLGGKALRLRLGFKRNLLFIGRSIVNVMGETKACATILPNPTARKCRKLQFTG